MSRLDDGPHHPQPAGKKFRRASGRDSIEAIELLAAGGADCPNSQQRQALLEGLIDDIATIIASRLLRRKGRRSEADAILNSNPSCLINSGFPIFDNTSLSRIPFCILI